MFDGFKAIIPAKFLLTFSGISAEYRAGTEFSTKAMV
jgi:hypothetical protein